MKVMITMTFMQLQNQLLQTKKARKGVSNRRDYYADENNNYEFDEAVYRKALSVANKIIRHYYDLKEIDGNEKISIIFGDNKKTNKANSDKTSLENESLKIENQQLQNKILELKKQLEEFKNKFKNGGRKGYNDTMIQAVKIAREQGETWRSLAKKLHISTTTAQKLYKL